MATRTPALATVADIAGRRDADRLEIIHGTIVERVMPSPEHSLRSAKLGAITDPFNRRPGPRGPGGWWIHVEVHVEHEPHELCCHDAAGWRRERVPERPTGWPVRIRPDWVCEILSATSGQRVRAEPVEAIEIDVGELFGEESDPPP